MKYAAVLSHDEKEKKIILSNKLNAVNHLLGSVCQTKAFIKHIVLYEEMPFLFLPSCMKVFHSKFHFILLINYTCH